MLKNQDIKEKRESRETYFAIVKHYRKGELRCGNGDRKLLNEGSCEVHEGEH